MLLLTLLLALAGPPPPAAPGAATLRLVLKLVANPGQVPQVTVENAASAAVSVGGESYLSLTPPGEDAKPAYWARLDTPATPSRHGAVQLAAKEKRTAGLKPAGVLWAPDRSGVAPEQPLGQAVPPGRYRLQVQIQAPDDEGWWRSNEIDVTVGHAGTIKYE